MEQVWLNSAQFLGDSVMDRWDGQTDGRKNNVALTHPYHAWKSCSKFG